MKFTVYTPLVSASPRFHPAFFPYFHIKITIFPYHDHEHIATLLKSLVKKILPHPSYDLKCACIQKQLPHSYHLGDRPPTFTTHTH